MTPRRRETATGTMKARNRPVEARSIRTSPLVSPPAAPAARTTSAPGTNPARPARPTRSTSFARIVNCSLQRVSPMAVTPVRLDDLGSLSIAPLRRPFPLRPGLGSSTRLDDGPGLPGCSGLEDAVGRAAQRDHARHVDDERDPAVPENGGSGDPLEFPEIGLEALDHDLLLVQELVHQQADPAPLVLHDDDEPVARIIAVGAHAEEASKSEHREGFGPTSDHLAATRQVPKIPASGLDGLDNGRQRQDVCLSAHTERLPVEDGQSERELEPEGRAAPALALDRDGAAEERHIPLDHVQPDPAPGNLGDAFGGGEAGLENKVENLLVGQGALAEAKPGCGRLGEDAGTVQPPPVVADFDVDAAALLVGSEPEPAGLGLAGAPAHLGSLDAVVHRVPHQVEERVADLLDDALVELGLLAGRLEHDLLAQRLGEVANAAADATEGHSNGEHAHGHDPVLETQHVR